MSNFSVFTKRKRFCCVEWENPKEIIFAVLAGRDRKKRELIAKQTISKLQILVSSESALSETLEDLEIISLLRGKRTEKLVKKQRKTMPIIIDIRKLSDTRKDS